jgi:hypothetical protein
MARDFTELYVEGDHSVVRGFVAGFLGGSCVDAPVLVNSDHGIVDDGFARQMAERIHLVETVTHLIVAEGVRETFINALQQHGAKLGLKLCGEFAIARARVKFAWEVYAPNEAVKIRRLFENERPAAVELTGYDPVEIVNNNAGDPGMYTPVHSFTVKASGTAQGPPDAIVGWVAMLEENDFIQLDRIELEYAHDS